MKILSNFLILLLVTSLAYSQMIAYRPIIGIVTIPSELQGYTSDQWSYVPSSYIKFVESGGAQVVPIPYDLPQANITYILDRLNGVFFPGGESPIVDAQTKNLTVYGQALGFIVNYVLNQNQHENYYPLWGTCLGFEAIVRILSQNFFILGNCDGCEGLSSNNFVNTKYTSKMFTSLPDDLRQKMTYANLSYFAHNYKLGIDEYQDNNNLLSLVTPTAFSYDALGAPYISAFESPEYPIYGIQFHQEKSTFEWHSAEPYNHNYDAVRLQQFLSNFLSREAQKNGNIFSGFKQYLINNYQAKVVHDSGYSSVYIFPNYQQPKDGTKFYSVWRAAFTIILMVVCVLL